MTTVLFAASLLFVVQMVSYTYVPYFIAMYFILEIAALQKNIHQKFIWMGNK